MKKLFLLAMFLPLAACAPTPAELSQTDDAKCSDFGFVQGTQAHTLCRLRMANQRNSDQFNDQVQMDAQRDANEANRRAQEASARADDAYWRELRNRHSYSSSYDSANPYRYLPQSSRPIGFKY